jgi:hypothetical protein
MNLPTEIVNPETGERIVFDGSASDSERLVWEEVKPANIEPPPVHHHPHTEERFEVTEGLLVVELDGEPRPVEAGEAIVIPPGTPHTSYTEAESARFRRAVSPPGQWREFLTARFAAVHEVGELAGVTGLLQIALLLRAYPGVVVPEQPPRAVRRVLFPVLAVAARGFGLKPHYPYPRTPTSTTEERPSDTTL